MLQLPNTILAHDDQRALGVAVANIDAALRLVRLAPTNLALWYGISIGLAAQQMLWKANLRLVMRIAIDVHHRTGADVDELFQEGCLALRAAIRRFRPELNFRLTTYAHDAIVRRLNAIDTSGVWLSNSTHFRRMRLRAMEYSSVSTSVLTFARNVGSEPLDSLPDPHDPFEDVNEAGVEFLDLLEPTLSAVLRMRYGIDGTVWPQDAVADYFGVSSSTISRWERRALQQARQVLTADRTTAIDPHGRTERSRRRPPREASAAVAASSHDHRRAAATHPG